MKEITTITFLEYSGFKDKYWAFKMMQLGNKPLSTVEGQKFFKLLGTGRGKGFNPLPDWDHYAILQVWEDESFIDKFIASAVFQPFKSRSVKTDIIKLECIAQKGEWSGVKPFKSVSRDDFNGEIAVITRATIKTSKLFSFWKQVPNSQKGLFNNQDLLFTKGIGEWPFTQMATFSIWNNEDAIKKFAYKGGGHKTAMQLAKKNKWFKEELFGRFRVLEKVTV